ncbi:PH domain-like protein [Saccharata proteae CBS 121410]|uniref:PH domain-like protein n=1 Tax=Saccharata proteae CBS 121410 TaxID=1314787 RepID=A0A9P4LUZ6_9PEZI|nr:PH domain-like protein [Saccharata proteae CBS 121410]
MSTRKSKPRNHQPQQPAQPSDYETDDYASFSVPAPPPRTNEQLNLSVLRRHSPDVAALLSTASYSVLYLFSPTSQQWEKCGIEGTLFVCQLTPTPAGAERYAAIILNRRGLDNFITELKTPEDVEITEEYVILQVAGEDERPQIFGVWIFSEPAPSSTANARDLNARVIQESAERAERSRRALEKQASRGMVDATDVADEQEQSVPMGRQLSLRELFGQQREQDSGFSIHNHHAPPEVLEPEVPQYAPPEPAKRQAYTPQFQTTADTDFFHSAPRVSSARPPAQTAPVATAGHGLGPQHNRNSAALLSLFTKPN